MNWLGVAVYPNRGRKRDGTKNGGTRFEMCRRGLHMLTPENVYLRTVNGRVGRQCKRCMNIAKQKKRHKAVTGL